MPDPENTSSILYEQGRDLLRQGKKAEAVEFLRRSVEHSPHFKTLELLGEALLDLGRSVEAIVPLAAATTLNPQVRAPSLLAKALLITGDRHAARRAALVAASRDPKNRIAVEVLAATVDLVHGGSSRKATSQPRKEDDSATCR